MSTSERQTGTGKSSLLIVVKGSHKYLIKYDPARRPELFDLLLSYGQSDDYNMTSFDALALMERLDGRKRSASVISLNENESSVERDLTFESPPAEAEEPDTGLEF